MNTRRTDSMSETFKTNRKKWEYLHENKNIVLCALNNLYINIKIKYKVTLMKIILILLYLPYTLCIKLETYISEKDLTLPILINKYLLDSSEDGDWKRIHFKMT